MQKLKNLCVFCGASMPGRELFSEVTQALADEMVKRDIGLVYGGGRVGLMGLIADGVMEQGGRSIGVIPEQLQRRELAHDGLSELHVVATMHERKQLMYDSSDAFVSLPGGFGTLDETMEILTWKQLGLHDKPVVLLNVDGYYDALESFFARATDEGLLKGEYTPLVHFAKDIPGLFAYLDTYDAAITQSKSWA
jgi:uncharacterized protein (TIGR00730 family)